LKFISIIEIFIFRANPGNIEFIIDVTPANSKKIKNYLLQDASEETQKIMAQKALKRGKSFKKRFFSF